MGPFPTADNGEVIDKGQTAVLKTLVVQRGFCKLLALLDAKKPSRNSREII